MAKRVDEQQHISRLHVDFDRALDIFGRSAAVIRPFMRAIAAQNDLVKLIRSMQQFDDDDATPTEVSDEITAPIELPRDAS